MADNTYHDHMNGTGLVSNVVQAADVVARDNLHKIALCTIKKAHVILEHIDPDS